MGRNGKLRTLGYISLLHPLFHAHFSDSGLGTEVPLFCLQPTLLSKGSDCRGATIWHSAQSSSDLLPEQMACPVHHTRSRVISRAARLRGK